MRTLLASSILALLALAPGCEATLESGLPEEEANAVVVALHAHEIGATKEREGTGDEARYAVIVAPEDVAPALEVLRAEHLPRDQAPGLHEVFGEPGLVPTATEERARYVAALGGELATSLEAIDGVLDARVHVALPESARLALDEDRPTPRASVLLTYRGDPPPYDADAVRALVAGAVQDMRVEDVAVVGTRAPAARATDGEGLVSLGPLTVTRGSSGTLKAILGGSLVLHLVVAGLLVAVLVRRRRAVVPDEPAA